MLYCTMRGWENQNPKTGRSPTLEAQRAPSPTVLCSRKRAIAEAFGRLISLESGAIPLESTAITP